MNLARRALRPLAFPLALAALLAFAGAAVSSGSDRSSWSGTFTVEERDEPGRVQLEIRRSGPRGFRFSSSSGVALSDLRGLSPMALKGAGSIAFTLARDAGTFEFDGDTRGGVGVGRFTFTPNPVFASAFSSKGRTLDEDDVFVAAVHDVSRAFLDDMAAAGYPDLSWERAIEFRIHGVSSEWLKDLAALGVTPSRGDDPVAMRIHGVKPEWVKGLVAAGFTDLDAHELVAMRIHGVSLAFVAACQDARIRGLDADALVALKIHGATPDFLAELVRLGYAGLDADDVVAMRIHGVSPAFIREANEGRSKPLPPEDLVDLRIHGRRR
ncbi:MAG: hypothetical protein JNK60_19640 [Acidobacteria bacterium]|nr:hypothetical protein [Acidobacteriota bacterium]